MIKIETVGIVAEYNPFHNGHLYQLKEAKRISGAKNIVAVMSGTVVQRGDFAIFDKWARAEAAVRNGINLVIELPCIYSGQTAEIFARGAIDIMHSLGVIDAISFGTEAADIDMITKTANLLLNETDEFKTVINNHLKNGDGYPTARSKALNELYGIDFADTPNNILAVEYTKAIIKNNYNIKVIPVLRKGSMHDGLGSASHIRELIKRNDNYSELVPYVIKRPPIFTEAFKDIILYKLRTANACELSNIADISEGLENRLISSASYSDSVEVLIDNVSTKRYSNARIRRAVINTVLNITKDDVKQKPSYIRVLGADEKGRELIKAIKAKCDLPVVTKVADYDRLPCLKKEITATSVYSIALNAKENPEYQNPPFIL